MSDKCPDCGKPEWDGGHAPNDARECYRRGDVVCSLTAKLRVSEAEVARLRQEVEALRPLVKAVDEFLDQLSDTGSKPKWDYCTCDLEPALEAARSALGAATAKP